MNGPKKQVFVLGKNFQASVVKHYFNGPSYKLQRNEVLWLPPQLSILKKLFFFISHPLVNKARVFVHNKHFLPCLLWAGEALLASLAEKAS
jgi:hypothetical protein